MQPPRNAIVTIVALLLNMLGVTLGANVPESFGTLAAATLLIGGFVAYSKEHIFPAVFFDAKWKTIALSIFSGVFIIGLGQYVYPVTAPGYIKLDAPLSGIALGAAAGAVASGLFDLIKSFVTMFSTQFFNVTQQAAIAQDAIRTPGLELKTALMQAVTPVVPLQAFGTSSPSPLEFFIEVFANLMSTVNAPLGAILKAIAPFMWELITGNFQLTEDTRLMIQKKAADLAAPFIKGV